VAGGYRSVHPVLGVAAPGTQQAGYKTPLPPWFGGGAGGGVQAGFRAPLPVWLPAGGESPAPVPIGYGSGYKSRDRSRAEGNIEEDLKARILQDDEEVLAIIMAALRVID